MSARGPEGDAPPRPGGPDAEASPPPGGPDAEASSPPGSPDAEASSRPVGPAAEVSARTGSRDAVPARDEVLHGWGLACHARSRVYRPRTAEEVGAAVADARARGLTVCHRGAGLSYGDAALNQGGAVVLLRDVNGLMALDAERGIVRVGAGMTVEELWQAVLPLGWWPPVVPGSMKATVGGCVAMNVHGKNHLGFGSFGDHVEALTVLTPEGELVALGKDGRGAGAHGAWASAPLRLGLVVGAQGLTGTIVDVTLRLHHVHSGYLEVEGISTATVEESVEVVGRGAADAPYSVGWIDCTAPGAAAGRGVLHVARYLDPDHPLAGKALEVGAQALPGRILGVVPRSYAWLGLKAFFHDPGMRALNLGRYVGGRVRHRHLYHQSHAGFHFLLDYVPGWKRVYQPGGLLQYQLFVPADAAVYAFGEALRMQRSLGVYSYLGVVKRHRPDPYAARYSVDGYSLALDFPVRTRRLAELVRLCRSYDALLREVGGHVYAAKDAASVGELPRLRHPAYSSNLVRRWERGEG